MEFLLNEELFVSNSEKMGLRFAECKGYNDAKVCVIESNKCEITDLEKAFTITVLSISNNKDLIDAFAVAPSVIVANNNYVIKFDKNGQWNEHMVINDQFTLSMGLLIQLDSSMPMISGYMLVHKKDSNIIQQKYKNYSVFSANGLGMNFMEELIPIDCPNNTKCGVVSVVYDDNTVKNFTSKNIWDFNVMSNTVWLTSNLDCSNLATKK